MPKLLADALADCRQHFVAAAVFSLLINLLYLAPTIYMLQVYDRVVPTGGKTTLLFVTMALALALLTLSLLDMVRNRLLVRASQRIDALIVPRILRQMMATNSAAAGQAMRDFDLFAPQWLRQQSRRSSMRLGRLYSCWWRSCSISGSASWRFLHPCSW